MRLRKLVELFGLAPLHDLDLPHEPTATVWNFETRQPANSDAIRAKLAALRQLHIDAVAVIDDMDPTGLGLADAADADEAIDYQLVNPIFLDEHRK